MMKMPAMRMKFHRLFASVCGLVIVTWAGPTWAGGLYLNEFATPSMGVAGAGAEAVASDASTSFALHNPAGMTRLEDNQFMLGAGFLVGNVEFDPDPNTPIPGNNGGDAGGPGPLLGAYYVHSLTDDLKLGANLFSFSGAILDYDDGWTGRFLVKDIELLTLTFNPSLAYRVNDWLSVGAGVTVMYAKLELTVAVPGPAGGGEVKIDGDDVDVGFNLGVLIELSERTRIGAIYQSEIDPDFSGDVTITPPGFQAGITTELPFVQLARIGIYHDLNDQWALLGTFGWEEWSAFEDILVSVARGSAALPRDWKDTYHFSGGVHFRPVDRWLLQGGITYDTSPVNSEDRTPDMPMDRQIRYAAGVQYQLSESMTIGASFVYADYGNARIRNSLLLGDYSKNEIFFFAINANWTFGKSAAPPTPAAKNAM